MRTLGELQRAQAEYDATYWQHNASELEKVRHITLHMGKLLGKLSAYCERAEHGTESSSQQLQDEVVSDLLVYSLQLANLFSLDLASKYEERQKANIMKLTGNGS